MKIETIITELMESNCYIIIDEINNKGVLIDPGGGKVKIQKKINDLNIQLEYIINTHGHIDHIYGDKDYDLPVYIHEYDADYLTDPNKNLSAFLGESVVIDNPIRVLKHADVLNVGDISIQIIHTPGHTPGSICLKKDDVLFTGDTLFNQGIGRTDFLDGSFDKLKDSILNRLFVLDDKTKIYPGHGPDSNIGHEKRNKIF